MTKSGNRPGGRIQVRRAWTGPGYTIELDGKTFGWQPSLASAVRAARETWEALSEERRVEH